MTTTRLTRNDGCAFGTVTVIDLRADLERLRRRIIRETEGYLSDPLSEPWGRRDAARGRSAVRARC
jgi:hypothetical protein